MMPDLQPEKNADHSSQGSWSVIYFAFLGIGVFAVGLFGYLWFDTASMNRLLNGRVESLETELRKQSLTIERLQSDKTVEPSGTSEASWQSVGVCDEKECLFLREEDGHPVGVALLRGYHTSYEDIGYEGPEVCDALVLEQGSQPLIDFYIRSVESGKQLYRLTEDGMPVVDIDLAQLDADDRRLFLSSTDKTPVEFRVYMREPLEVGLPACYMPFEVLSVRPLNRN